MRWVLLSALQLRRFRRGRMARGAIIVIVLLPLLYGAVYIYAFWNPYGTLSNLPVALVVEDRPAEVQGKEVFLGPRIQQQLVDGGQLGWHVVNAKQAAQGLSNNRYYFSVTIPEGFSAAVASLGSGAPHYAQIRVTNNESANFLTSLISAEAGKTIVDTVSAAVIDQFVATTLYGLQEIRSGMQKAADGAGQLADGTAQLASATRQLVSGTKRLANGAAQVAAGNAELARFGDIVRGWADVAEDDAAKVVQAVSDFAKKHPDDPLAKIALKIARDIDATIVVVVAKVDSATQQIDRLSDGSQQVANGAAELAAAAPKLHAGAVKLRNGARELAAGLASGVEQIPAMTPEQIAQTASVVSDPVQLATHDKNPVATYGTGFAPYFIPLSLWVGGLMAFMLLKALPARALLAPRVPALGAAVIGYLPVAAISVAQVVVLAAVLHFAVGVQATYPLLLMGFLILTGLVYVAILQMLNAALGTAGRVAALVLLMMQLTSSGGTYPVEMTPAFFQAISPFLPMTYVVSTIR
ncbi:MAG: YhgE/Pip family protein, partial [Candidatus Nanopelagicales bacterium]|nr:YhgE/Pip family protein [Candidatus Nanopelagicales bacterium]